MAATRRTIVLCCSSSPSPDAAAAAAAALPPPNGRPAVAAPPGPATAAAATVSGELNATTSPIKTLRSEGRGSRRTNSRSTASGWLQSWEAEGQGLFVGRQQGRPRLEVTPDVHRWVLGCSKGGYSLPKQSGASLTMRAAASGATQWAGTQRRAASWDHHSAAAASGGGGAAKRTWWPWG